MKFLDRYRRNNEVMDKTKMRKQEKIKKQENKEIYFGDLSSLIHNSLLDDPKPYRKEVKDLQANLYSFLKILDLEEIKIDQPNVSERIILIS